MSSTMKGYLIFLTVFSVVFPSFAFSQSRVVTLMTYNAENLFDTKHDPGKEDWTYMPLAAKRRNSEAQAYCRGLRNSYYRKNCLEFNWDMKALRGKIKNLARVIKATNRYKGPDIVVLEEVENLNVLKMLNRIGNLDYPYQVLIEGPDKRGIDVGILSRYPLARAPKNHKVDLGSDSKGAPRPTRGILEVSLSVGKKTLTIFGNHWSSQANPDGYRLIAARTLYNLARQRRGEAVIATGDFNTMPDDSPHGINTYLLNENRSVSFFDAREMGPFYEGTHWYKGEWSDLDRFFVLKSSTYQGGCRYNCIQPLWDSYEVYSRDWMLRELAYEDPETGRIYYYSGIPYRYDPETRQGFSDHLPVLFKVRI